MQEGEGVDGTYSKSIDHCGCGIQCRAIHCTMFGFFCVGIVMAGLGANDALRGVFSPIFKDHFTLSSVQISEATTAEKLDSNAKIAIDTNAFVRNLSL